MQKKIILDIGAIRSKRFSYLGLLYSIYITHLYTLICYLYMCLGFLRCILCKSNENVTKQALCSFQITNRKIILIFEKIPSFCVSYFSCIFEFNSLFRNRMISWKIQTTTWTSHFFVICSKFVLKNSYTSEFHH